MTITRSGKRCGIDKYLSETKNTLKNDNKMDQNSIDIDFDLAHKEWIKNKIKLKNGVYKYKY